MEDFFKGFEKTGGVLKEYKHLKGVLSNLDKSIGNLSGKSNKISGFAKKHKKKLIGAGGAVGALGALNAGTNAVGKNVPLSKDKNRGLKQAILPGSFGYYAGKDTAKKRKVFDRILGLSD